MLIDAVQPPLADVAAPYAGFVTRLSGVKVKDVLPVLEEDVWLGVIAVNPALKVLDVPVPLGPEYIVTD